MRPDAARVQDAAPCHSLIAAGYACCPTEHKGDTAWCHTCCPAGASQQAVFLLDLGRPDTAEQIMRLLRPVLEDPAKVKVFHGGANDLQGLRQQFGIEVAGHMDTQVGLCCGPPLLCTP
jgi:hypothetical protein